MSEQRILSFVAEWYDPHPQIVKKFLLKFYPQTHEVELKEVNSGRKFLKKTKLPSLIKEADFFIRNTINIFSRDMKLVDYGDIQTSKALDKSSEKCIVIALTKTLSLGNFIQCFEEMGLYITSIQSQLKFQKESIDALQDTISFPLTYTIGEVAIAVSVRGLRALHRCNEQRSNLSVRFGQIFCTTSEEETRRVEEHIKKDSSSYYDTKKDLEVSTCCVIKPHIIQSRKVSSIIKSIEDGGFIVKCIDTFNLNYSDAEEFYSAYKDVLNDYNQVVKSFCGTVVVLEVTQTEASSVVVANFRKLVGPWDSSIAKELFPGSIRAKYGEDHILNAVHCTDLATDNMLELEYFLSVLRSRNHRSH